ncbi:MAG: MFS transporter [Promethearchaeota archaeon]
MENEQIDRTNSATLSSEKKVLGMKEKLAYASGQIPGSFFGSFTGQIQAFYYAWMGLQIKYIIITQILYGIWNAVNDPIFGLLQDRTKTKKGRYIPWIKWASFLFSLSFIMIFFPLPQWRYAESGVQYQITLALWYLLSQMLYDTFFTIIYLAYTALLPQMTMNEEERTQITILVAIMGTIGMIASAGFPLIYLTNPTAEKISEFQMTVIVIAIIALIPWIAIIKYVKERQEFIPEEETSLWQNFKYVFKNPSGRIYIIYDGVSVGINTALMTAVTFIIPWIFGINPDFDSSSAQSFEPLIPYSIPLLICLFVGLFIELKIPKKYDVKTALMYSLVTEAIGLFIAYFGVLLSPNLTYDQFHAPQYLWIVVMGLSIMLLGYLGDPIYHNVMRADTIDYDEYLTGERREAVYAGIGCILSKPMISVALATVPSIMGSFGLLPASPDDPVNTALVVTQGFRNATLGVASAAFLFPGILAVLGAISWYFYPLDRKRLKEVRAYLDELHEKKRKERLNEDGYSKFLK